MKKIIKVILLAFLCVVVLSSCKNTNANDKFNFENKINVVDREDGSGTRNSLFSMLKLSDKNINSDNFTVANGSEMMIEAVQNDIYSIGYVSNSFVNQEVKTVSVNGVFPTSENIENEKYPLIRNFSLLTKNNSNSTTLKNEVIEDFMNFVYYSDTISKEGYHKISENKEYESKNFTEETIKIAGSSSVGKLIEKISEEYKIKNPNVKIEIQITDSTNGLKNLNDEIVDIAMTSKEFSNEELNSVQSTIIAKDAISIIVNKSNKIDNLKLSDLEKIYTESSTGSIKWSVFN